MKEFVYSEGKQHFYEKSNLKDGIRYSDFIIKEKKEKIIHNKNVTVVILDDGTKGISKCSKDDMYNKTNGIKIAYLRAKIKSLQKELNVLLK